MRVLLILPKYYGPPWREGVTNIARRFAQYLSAKNNEVLIACPGRGVSTEETGEFGEKIYYTRPLKDRRAKDRRPWIRAWFWLRMIRLVRTLADKSQPDVAILVASGSLFLGPRTLLIKSLLGSRLIVYVTGLNKPTFGINWFLPKIELLVGSPFLLRWFPRATVAYPVIPSHFKPPADPAIERQPDSPLSLLYLGTAQKERGVMYLLAGVAAAREGTQRPLRLTLALNGTGNENEEHVRDSIVGLGLEDIVSLQRVVDADEAYRETDVVLIPRQVPTRMSFPLRILESLSYGRPVIVTDVCDMGSLVDGCGLVVDPTDPGTLAKAIVTLAEDSSLYHRLSHNCATVLQRYDSTKTLETVHSVLERVGRGSLT